MIRADDIHARLAASWPTVLIRLGIDESALQNKHGPCPACGGKDRFRFDNRRGRGDFYCNRCGAGDGFRLLELTFGWTFSMARQRVLAAAGFSDGDIGTMTLTHLPEPPPAPSSQPLANPPERIHRLRRGRCAIENCADAIEYLESRSLWPLPANCTLRAHASADYWNDGRLIGRYPAIVADVVDLTGDLVTCHVTYLHAGRKLADYEPRKLLSSVTGRVGCAVRLMPATDVLGIAEGIETALSAAILHGIPVWAATSTALLSRFQPPSGVTTLRVYADCDEPGMRGALRLLESIQGQVRIETRTPLAPAKDWNDVLVKRQKPF